MKSSSKITDLLNHLRFVGFTYRMAFTMVSLSLLSTIMEVFGLTIFLPIFQFIRFDGNIESLVAESSIWKYVIDVFSLIGFEVSLLGLLLVAFFFLSCRQIFTYLRILYFATKSAYFNKKLRDKLFDSYMSANSSYHDSVPVGNIVNVMTTEIRSAVGVIISPMEIVVSSIIILAYFFVLLALSFEMTLASILVLLLAARVPKGWFRKSAQIGRKFVSANTKMSSFLVERLKSPRLVLLSGTIKAEQDEFYSLTQEQKDHSINSSKLYGKTDVVLEPIIIGFSLFFLYFAFTYLNMKIEEIGLYLVIILRLTPVTKGILLLWQSIQRSIGSIEIVEKRFHTMINAKEMDNGIAKIDRFQNKIEFINVGYKYPSSNKNALEKINFKISPGSMTAIVGPSGSGKSTLVDLFPRLREISTGKILIDSTPLEDFSLDELRKFISYTPQDPQIFNGTIANHIRYGKLNATDSEVIYAAKLSGANKFIDSLPKQYETFLDEDAINLSGGERQRLDLARALIKKSFLLILDEPASNLDVESVEAFNKSLQRIRENKDIAIIVISHSLQSIVDADQIIVLSNGKVESIGNHNDLLLMSDGWYAKSWNKES